MDWSTKTIYVDIETGQVLKRDLALKHYIVIKTTKDAKQIKHTSRGLITITKLCQRDRQLKIAYSEYRDT